jgi:ABC-type nickel/cobalt efflux system permease component RcnA
MKVLGLDLVTAFLLSVLDSVVNIVVAVIVFVVAVLIARFVRRLAKGTAKAMKVKSDDFIGSLASFVVYFLAFVTILGLFDITSVILRYIDIIVY